jgi:putative salt-induced outer membrane protein
MRTHILLAAALCAGAPLAAQDTAKTSLTLDFGLVNATGNSEFTSINTGEKLAWTKGRWGLSQTGKVLFGQTANVTTTESYDFNVRGDRGLSARVGVFVFVAYYRDPFAGLASRWSGGPGVAVGLVRATRDTLNLEGAFTEQSERTTAAIDRSFAATRTAAAYKHAFKSNAFFTQTLEWLANLETSDDYRLNSETAVVAPLSSKIGLRLSYVIRFDNQPEPTFKKTDRILTTGVQIAF